MKKIMIIEDDEKISILEEKINNISKTTNSTSDTRLEIKEACVGLSAIVTFIGLYLGIIFIISSAAILSLKQLSDSIDDKDKYKVLRNIGTDEKDINKAIFKQALILFMMPLLLAIIHTIFGIKFCMFILNSMWITNLLKPTIITFIFLLVIYGLYFIITYFSSKNIIKERA